MVLGKLFSKQILNRYILDEISLKFFLEDILYFKKKGEKLNGFNYDKNLSCYYSLVNSLVQTENGNTQKMNNLFSVKIKKKT